MRIVLDPVCTFGAPRNDSVAGPRNNEVERYITPMTDPAAIRIEIPTRAPSATSADDTVMPFEVAALDLRGRVVRLGPLDRPDSRAARLSAIRWPSCWARRWCSPSCSARRSRSTAASFCRRKATGRCACWWWTSPRPARCAPAPASTKTGSPRRSPRARPTRGALLGKGHLAMTIDQGPDMSRYQGLVALEGGSLEDAAHEYFLRSEQIPTRVRLAVAEELRAGERRRQASLARRRHLAAIPAQVAGARARRRSRSRRCSGRHRAAHGRRGRGLGRRPRADRHRRGCRVDRSGAVERAAGLSSVPRARRARVPRHRGARANARARATASRLCSKASRRTTATIWSRTARFPSPANSAARIMNSRRARSTAKSTCQGLAYIYAAR